jgi:RNA polymerase sigma factor (sigma-70 family)
VERVVVFTLPARSRRAQIHAMPPRSSFSATQWTIVQAARGNDSRASRALAELCERYWPPLYAFARRGGHSPEDAEDAVQGFFADLLKREGLSSVDRSKGRFRSFLLASFKNFLSNERARAAAQKRGGDRVILELDAREAEERYALEPRDELSPDKLYDRHWARVLLSRAQERLAENYAADGKGELFHLLRPVLGVSRAQISYAVLGAQLGMTEGAVKIAAHRLRERYRAILRDEVAATVNSPEEIDLELRHLIDAL